MDLEMDAEIELETIKQIRHCELGEYSHVSKKRLPWRELRWLWPASFRLGRPNKASREITFVPLFDDG